MRLQFYLWFSLLLYACSSAPNKIAWLSDTHVAPGTTGSEDLQAVVQDINQQQDIACAIISGDITDHNTGNNLLMAKQILDRLTVPYYIIPGNHDTKWTDSGLQKFKKLFGDDKFSFTFQGILFLGLHQGPVLRMADGHFSPADLQWLTSTLNSLPQPNQPIVVVTHYPLAPPFTIDNYAQFMQRIQPFNIKLILHGHGHRNRKSLAYGIPQIMGRSILRRNGVPAYNLIEFRNHHLLFSEKKVGDQNITLWATIDLQANYNVQDSLMLPADFSINQQFPQVQEQWVKRFDALITASPQVAEERVYIGDHQGNFYCLNVQTGEELWKHHFAGAIFSQVTIHNGHVLVSCADSNIYALRSLDGAIEWQFHTNAPLYAVPVAAQDTVFVAGNDGKVYALKVQTGKQLWNFNGINGYVETRPLLTKGLMIFGAWDGKIYALQRSNGQLKWQWHSSQKNILFSPAACWPVAINNLLYFTAPDRYLYCVDLRNGSTLWRSNRFKVRETLGADRTHIYVQCMRDTVFALQPNPQKPDYQWIRNLKFGYDIANSMIQISGQVGFFGTKNGLIVAFNRKTGQILWKHKIGNSFIPTVHPLSEHSLVVSSMDGLVVRLTAY